MAEKAESTTNLTYEKLFELLRSEKNNAALQKLSETFFEDVQIYMDSKLAIIKKHSDSENVFSQKELEKTSKQLANAKKILKMLYDLREKKIVTMALNKSRTASSLIDTSGIHVQEMAMFKDLVELMDKYRGQLLTMLLEGKHTVSASAPASAPAPEVAGMQLVRFIDDVEEFVDSDMKRYGPFQEEDIANLPAEVVKLLQKRSKVQVLDSEQAATTQS